MVLQPLLGSAELLSYICTNETVLSLVSSTCLLRNKMHGHEHAGPHAGVLAHAEKPHVYWPEGRPAKLR